MKVETDIIISIAASLIERALILTNQNVYRDLKTLTHILTLSDTTGVKRWQIIFSISQCIDTDNITQRNQSKLPIIKYILLIKRKLLPLYVLLHLSTYTNTQVEFYIYTFNPTVLEVYFNMLKKSLELDFSWQIFCSSPQPDSIPHHWYTAAPNWLA